MRRLAALALAAVVSTQASQRRTATSETTTTPFCKLHEGKSLAKSDGAAAAMVRWPGSSPSGRLGCTAASATTVSLGRMTSCK